MSLIRQLSTHCFVAAFRLRVAVIDSASTVTLQYTHMNQSYYTNAGLQTGWKQYRSQFEIKVEAQS